MGGVIPKIVFCPRCHKPIKVRIKGLENLTVGTITFECGDKNCSGKVVLKQKEKV